ncbi:MAG TPA: hypothetical protein VM328_07905 [Fimbriimonadaceae bacterium]|nr:hypothetical protein [Fimbriimonadaceae bacterium]HVM36587.1 hypothetical protein [Actinomycetota bacterium]
MELAAPTIFGLSEFWTGAVMVIAVAVAVSVGVVIWDWLTAVLPSPNQRRWEREWKEQERAARGVVICDFVDKQVLASVARQEGVPFQPTRTEKGSATSTSGNVEGGKGIRARLGRERKHDERSFYDLVEDHNALLADLLASFENLEGGAGVHRGIELLP